MQLGQPDAGRRRPPSFCGQSSSPGRWARPARAGSTRARAGRRSRGSRPAPARRWPSPRYRRRRTIAALRKKARPQQLGQGGGIGERRGRIVGNAGEGAAHAEAAGARMAELEIDAQQAVAVRERVSQGAGCPGCRGCRGSAPGQGGRPSGGEQQESDEDPLHGGGSWQSWATPAPLAHSSQICSWSLRGPGQHLPQPFVRVLTSSQSPPAAAIRSPVDREAALPQRDEPGRPPGSRARGIDLFVSSESLAQRLAQQSARAGAGQGLQAVGAPAVRRAGSKIGRRAG